MFFLQVLVLDFEELLTLLFELVGELEDLLLFLGV